MSHGSRFSQQSRDLGEMSLEPRLAISPTSTALPKAKTTKMNQIKKEMTKKKGHLYLGDQPEMECGNKKFQKK